MQKKIAGLLLLAFAGVSEAQTPKAAVDHYGDALPDGAIARLGTVRFRHGLRAEAVAYAPSGDVLASVGRFRGVALWDATSGRLLHEIPVHRFAQSLAFSLDGKKLVTALSLIDVAAGKEFVKFSADADDDLDVGTCAAFSPDGTIVASGGYRRKDRIVFLDAKTGKELRRTSGHDAGSFVNSLAFSPKDGRLLASANLDKTVHVWDVATAKQIHRLEGHGESVSFVAFALDGKTLVSVGEDGPIHLWDVETGKLVRQMKAAGIQLAATALSPDGKTLARSGLGGIIYLCNLETGKEIRRWETHSRYISSLAFAPEGKKLASASSGAVRQWDTENGKEINPTPGHRSMVFSLRFSADAKTLLSYGGDKQILEWDVASRQESGRRFSVLSARPPDDAWLQAELSPDGKTIAQTSVTFFPERKFDPVIHLWDTATGKERHALSGHKDRVDEIQFSPNGKLLASAGVDGIRLWNVETGKEAHHMLGTVYTTTLAFGPDSKTLVSAGRDGMIRRWNVAAGKEVRSWSSGQGRVDILAFSPDGGLVATRDENAIHVWDAQAGDQATRIAAQNVYALAFSPTGRVLAGGWYGSRTDDAYNVEGVIKSWEVHSGQEIRQIDTPHNLIRALAFTPDGRTLASGGGDSTILFWNVAGHANAKPASSAKQFDALWSDLRADAAKADRALWTFALAPEKSVPFLKERLQQAPAADAKRLAKLMGDLDSQNFADRQNAERDLIELGEAAEAALRKCLASSTSLELRRRVEQILQKRGPDMLRQLRAIDTLEQIGTPAAREILQSLANATPNPRVAQAARRALGRLTP